MNHTLRNPLRTAAQSTRRADLTPSVFRAGVRPGEQHEILTLVWECLAGTQLTSHWTLLPGSGRTLRG